MNDQYVGRICDVTKFTIREVTECGIKIRTLNKGATSMEEVAGKVVRYLYDTLYDGETGTRACSLVRFFKTHTFKKLDKELKDFAKGMLGGCDADPGIKCLTLLGTVGEKAEWNSRKTSKGHMAIPLPSEKAVEEIPMMRNLVKQLGIDVSQVVKPDPNLLLEMDQKTFNVFLVPEALGSSYIPAQEAFVIPYGIRSVVGFGGMLPKGDIFIVIMFMRAQITREAANLFKNLSLNLKLELLPFEQKVFTQ